MRCVVREEMKRGCCEGASEHQQTEASGTRMMKMMENGQKRAAMSGRRAQWWAQLI